MDSTGTRLKALRESKGLSPEALSRVLRNRKDISLDVSRETIDKWERGTRTPNANAVVSLARYFGVSTDYFLGLDEYWASHNHLQITAATLGLSDKATENLIMLRSAEGGLVADVLAAILESPLLMDTLIEANKSRAGISRQLHYCKDDRTEGHREQFIDMSDMYVIKALRKTEGLLRDALGYNAVASYKEATQNGDR